MVRLFRFALVTLLAGFGAATGKAADATVPAVPTPKPPFIARAADQSSWLIVITPANAQAGAASNAQSKLLRAQLWTKSGTALQCANAWSDGTQTEDTVVGKTKIAQSPDGKGVREFNPRLDPRFHDFSTGDFELLDWITPENYVGVVTHAGEPCYLFQTKGITASASLSEPHNRSLAEINTPFSPTSVYVSVHTGLPVEIDNTSDKYVFQFGAPGELRMPQAQPPAPPPPPAPPAPPPTKPKPKKTPAPAPKPVKKSDSDETSDL